ncbi:MAG: GDP-L-fucose synthase [Thermodesulfovibrionales bacterium]|jgi:GDP-L-fucose synthase
MPRDARIYIAGHRGLVGSAVERALRRGGYVNLIDRTSRELDLRWQSEVEAFFERERPEYVFLAAAKVGGILANNSYKAEFIYDNMMIAFNVINSAHKFGVKKLLNLGSSCIYPKFAPQPMREEHLLTGVLEPTNEPYAIAKIAAIKLCRYYNEQYGTDFISVMPTNLYGPGDNFDLMGSHVLPALIRKFHLAKLSMTGDRDGIHRDEARYGRIPDDLLSSLGLHRDHQNPSLLTPFSSQPPKVVLWESGEPYREFLHVDDLADACIFLMGNCDYQQIGEFINIGTGEDIRIKDLARITSNIVGFEGTVRHDPSKPDGTPRKLLDVSRIHSLGWRSKIRLEEGIRTTYQWYVENR